MLDSELLAKNIEAQIRAAVDTSVEQYVERIIQQLALDPKWVEKIEQQINQMYSRKFEQRLNSIDLNVLVLENLDRSMDRWQEKLKQDFHTAGISDLATETQVTVMDDITAVANELIAKNLVIDQNASVQGDLRVKNLILTGVVNTDNRSWDELSNVIAGKTLDNMTQRWKQDLTQEVLDLAKTQGINFSEVLIQDQPLLQDGRLNAAIIHSSLHSVGALESLQVNGTSNLGSTMHVANKRVGINTASPEMALSVWDEEVSIIAGKLKNQQAFIGTGRSQGLTIGVNRSPSIEIDAEGNVKLKSLTVGRFRITHEASAPGYSGTKGDIVFNSDPKPDQPFAWICLGAFRWQALRSA